MSRRTRCFAALRFAAIASCAYGSTEQDGEDPTLCTTGAAGVLLDLYPGCLAGCEDSCLAINAAAMAFLQGGAAEVGKAICDHSEALRCFVAAQHVGNCAGLFGEAVANGLELPRTEAEMEAMCSAPSQAAKAEALEEAALPTAAIGCAGHVAGIAQKTPLPDDDCRSSCAAVDDALAAYLVGGSVAAWRSVCGHRFAFERLLLRGGEARMRCGPVVERASDKEAPPLMALQLSSRCEAALHAGDGGSDVLLP